MPRKIGAGIGREASEAVEDRPVLQSQIEECASQRECDHDCIDPFGARGERAGQRSESDRDDDRERCRHPPRPEQADVGQRARSEHRDHVTGEAGNGHLHQTDHAAVAGEEHQRQRDHAEDQGPADDLGEHEIARDRRKKHQHETKQQDRRVCSETHARDAPLPAPDRRRAASMVCEIAI